MDMLIKGKYIITSANDGPDNILEDAAVYVSGDKVVRVDDFRKLKEAYPEAKVVGNGRQLAMPGLIDGHSHGWGLSAIQRGVPNDFLENALIDWAFMLNLDPELNSLMSAIRHLRGGCTTLHHNNWGEEPNLLGNAEAAIKAYRKVGIRLAYSPGGRNKNRLALDEEDFVRTLPPDLQEFVRPSLEYDKEEFVDSYLALFDELHKRYNDEKTRIILGPSWAQGSTESFLRRVKARADELGKVPIHIHTLQTPIQKAYGLRKYGKSLAAYLDDLGLVDENLVLGHAVFLSEADIDLLAGKKASVTHHPSCNLAVRNGIAPVYHLHRAGVNVSLGMDDKAINDDEDAIMELRMIHRLHRVPDFNLTGSPALSAFDVLKMGTVNAARVCGFGGEIGELKPGMKADVILIDLEEIQNNPWLSAEVDMAEAFIHRAKGIHVHTAVVGGQVVMEDRKILNVDVSAIYEEVRRKAAQGISREQREFAETLQKIKPYYQQWYQGWDDFEYEPFYAMNSRR